MPYSARGIGPLPGSLPFPRPPSMLPPPGAMLPPPGAMVPPFGAMVPPPNSFPPFLMRAPPPSEMQGRMPFMPNSPSGGMPSISSGKGSVTLGGLVNVPVSSAETSKTSVQDSHVSSDPELQRQRDERQAGVRLLQTVCKFMIGILSRNLYPIKAELFEFLPMLCLNESNELEPELARDCMSALSVMSGSLLSPDLVSVSVDGITSVCKSQSWKAKVCGLEFLQVQIFTNFPVFLCAPQSSTQTLIDTVTDLLQDPQLEVREKAGTVLSGLFHCGFITSEQREKNDDQLYSDCQQ